MRWRERHGQSIQVPCDALWVSAYTGVRHAFNVCNSICLPWRLVAILQCRLCLKHTVCGRLVVSVNGLRKTCRIWNMWALHYVLLKIDLTKQQTLYYSWHYSITVKTTLRTRLYPHEDRENKVKLKIWNQPFLWNMVIKTLNLAFKGS